MKKIFLISPIMAMIVAPAMADDGHITTSDVNDPSQCAQYGAVWDDQNSWCKFNYTACDSAGGKWYNMSSGNGSFCMTSFLCGTNNTSFVSFDNADYRFRWDPTSKECMLDNVIWYNGSYHTVEGFTVENCSAVGGYIASSSQSCDLSGCSTSVVPSFSGCRINADYPGETGGGNPSGDDPNSGNEPSGSPFRVARTTVTNADGLVIASGAYSKGAYNANVGNINTSLGYVEESSIATINAAKVSANNMNLSVNGFTPSGTVNVNSNSATINGSFNVPTTVAMLDSWGADTTTNGTLGGIQPTNITNGSVSGIDATFTGTASGDLSGTGSFSNASVHVDGWVPDNPS